MMTAQQILDEFTDVYQHVITDVRDHELVIEMMEKYADQFKPKDIEEAKSLIFEIAAQFGIRLETF